jgi:hypothetical protein
VPFSRTDEPVAPVATVVPIAVRSYFTVALVAESTVTESTLDDTAAASGLDANAAIEAENCDPFCSSPSRSLFGVEELKNLVQLAVISATAADEPVAAPAEVAADEAADDGAAAAEVAAGAEDAEELGLLEQADITATSMRPSAGAR